MLINDDGFKNFCSSVMGKGGSDNTGDADLYLAIVTALIN